VISGTGKQVDKCDWSTKCYKYLYAITDHLSDSPWSVCRRNRIINTDNVNYCYGTRTGMPSWRDPETRLSVDVRRRPQRAAAAARPQRAAATLCCYGCERPSPPLLLLELCVGKVVEINYGLNQNSATVAWCRILSLICVENLITMLLLLLLLFRPNYDFLIVLVQLHQHIAL